MKPRGDACVYAEVRGSAAAGWSKRTRSRKGNCRNSVVLRVVYATTDIVQDLRNARHGPYNDCKRSVAS